MSQPFIVTAALPKEIQSWADGLRKKYYPVNRNKLHAHVTLFHSFAPSLFEELKTFLPSVTSEFAKPKGNISGVMDLGKGTALSIESVSMLDIRKLVADHFHGSLTSQDSYEPRLHVTIQNKVSKEEARALQAYLTASFRPRRFEFPSLELHVYRDGPWELVKRCAFRGNTC